MMFSVLLINQQSLRTPRVSFCQYKEGKHLRMRCRSSIDDVSRIGKRNKVSMLRVMIRMNNLTHELLFNESIIRSFS